MRSRTKSGRRSYKPSKEHLSDMACEARTGEKNRRNAEMRDSDNGRQEKATRQKEKENMQQQEIEES